MTYTAGPSGGSGSWASLDLAQCVAPLPAACGTTEDSRIWKGVLSSAPANIQFVVQAANGIGLVSFDDNLGSYFTATASGAPVTPAATTLALISPPSGGTFGDLPTITAELKSAGSPVVGKVVYVTIGGSGAVGVTGTNGRVALKVALNSLPGPTTISASFGGAPGLAPSSAAGSPFTIAKAPTAIAPFSAFVANTASTNSGVVTRLTATIGGKSQPLIQQTMTFHLTGPVDRTVSVITDYLGQATLPRDFPAGTYAVTATFGGDATYLPATRLGTLVVAPFTGFFSPIDNLPTVNTAKAGSTIPVKFSLGGNRGLSIFAAGYPKAIKVACSPGDPQAAVEEVTTSNSGLVYDATSDRYQYNWKTLKSYAGSCYRLEVRFIDGSTFAASFKFK